LSPSIDSGISLNSQEIILTVSEISSIRFKEEGIFLTLRISQEEYEFLKSKTSDILVAPVDGKSMDKQLTTGKLGNSTRLMLPKKALDALEAKAIEKKVPGKVFRIGDSIYILARLCKSERHKAT